MCSIENNYLFFTSFELDDEISEPVIRQGLPCSNVCLLGIHEAHFVDVTMSFQYTLHQLNGITKQNF